MKRSCTILLLWFLCWLPGRTAATGYTLDNLPDVHRADALLLSLFHLLWIRSHLRPFRQADAYTRYRALAPCKSTAPLFGLLFPLFAALTWIWLHRKMNRLRNGRHDCSRCGHPMQKLGENEDNRYLTPQGDTEERIDSVDYDVWQCSRCRNIQIYPYENTYTRYTRCPRCQARAFALESNRVTTPPTRFSNGIGEKRYRCLHCGEEEIKHYTIPRSVVPVGGGSGSSFGGGGHFGGGRSGGGGATSGW